MNVLYELKKSNLYHMDIKPKNILMSERYINENEFNADLHRDSIIKYIIR